MKKLFATEAVLTVATNRSLCGFDQMHELAEWAVGYPLWTHEFASKPLWDKMRSKLLAQYPDLPDGEGIDDDNWLQFIEDNKVKYGTKMWVEQGTDQRDKGPVETLKELVGDKPIIVLEKKDDIST